MTRKYDIIRSHICFTLLCFPYILQCLSSVLDIGFANSESISTDTLNMTKMRALVKLSRRSTCYVENIERKARM